MIEREAGFRKLQGYHDCRITSVSYSSSRLILEIAFRSESGETRIMRLHKCRIYRLNDFVPQSIVSRILVFSGSAVDRQFITQKIHWATSLSDSSSYLAASAAEEIITSIIQNELFLLLVEPSWGADLVALFVDLEEIVKETPDQ